MAADKSRYAVASICKRSCLPWWVADSRDRVRCRVRRRTVPGGCRSGRQVPVGAGSSGRVGLCRPAPADRSTAPDPCTTPRSARAASSIPAPCRLPPSCIHRVTAAPLSVDELGALRVTNQAVLGASITNTNTQTQTVSRPTTTTCSLRRLIQNSPAIRHNTRCCFNVQSKADISQLNLPHGTNN